MFFQLVEQKPKGRVVVLMGSSSDKEFGKKIQKQCLVFGIACVLRVTSAHKGPDSTLKIVAEYEGKLLSHCSTNVILYFL